MPVYIPTDYITLESSTSSFYVLFQHKTDPSIGYELNFKKVSNIRAIDAIYEGQAYKAWYPSHAGDYTSNGSTTVSILESTANNTKYYNISSTTIKVGWVNDSGINIDKIRFRMVGVNAGGKVKVFKNPGAGEVELGVIDSNSSGTNYFYESTLTCSTTLSVGDVLEVRGDSGTFRLKGFIGYNSEKAMNGYNGPFVITDKQLLNTSGSSVEFAYSLKLTSYSTSILRWIGGVAHQGSTAYMLEKNVVDVWTKNSSTWSVVSGFSTGNFSLHRQSDVDWDGSTNIVATLDYTYVFDKNRYGVSHMFECSTNFLIGTCYPLMANASPSTNMFTMFNFDPLLHEDINILTSSTGHIDCETSDLSVVKGVYYGKTPLGKYWHVYKTFLTDEPTSIFVNKVDAYNKFYITFAPSVLQGDVIGGIWWSEFLSSKGMQSLDNEMGGYAVGENWSGSVLGSMVDSLNSGIK